jgi:hypothetical protein
VQSSGAGLLNSIEAERSTVSLRLNHDLLPATAQDDIGAVVARRLGHDGAVAQVRKELCKRVLELDPGHPVEPVHVGRAQPGHVFLIRPHLVERLLVGEPTRGECPLAAL